MLNLRGSQVRARLLGVVAAICLHLDGMLVAAVLHQLRICLTDGYNLQQEGVDEGGAGSSGLGPRCKGILLVYVSNMQACSYLSPAARTRGLGEMLCKMG
jgi:hypothetical protein